jgi:hypothetical protein
VHLSRGEVRADLRLRWDSRGIAGAVCPDFEARLAVTGGVVPRAYTLTGRLEGGVDEAKLTAIPSFPDLQVNLQIEPSRESWKALDRLLDRRGLRCRAALKLVDVPGQIRRALAAGFDVRIPPTIVKPLTFPAGLQRELTREGRHTRLRVLPRQLVVTPKLVWYSADVETEGMPSATPGPSLPLEPGAEPVEAVPAVEAAPPPTPKPTPPLEAPSAPEPVPTSTATPTPAPPPAPTPAPTPVEPSATGAAPAAETPPETETPPEAEPAPEPAPTPTPTPAPTTPPPPA